METPSPEDGTANQESSSVGSLVVASFQIGIGVLGILGNGLCFFVLRLQSKTNNTNWLIVNQCSTDLITSVLLIAATIHLQWSAVPPTNPEHASELYCRLWNSRIIYFTGFAISSFNLTLISMERYLAVLHPILYMTKFKRRTMYMMAAVSWLTAPILQAVMLFVQFDFDSGQCNYISTGPAIGVVVFFWEYFIPVSIMGYCFICISFKLRTLNKVTDTSKEANTGSTALQGSCVNGDESSAAQNIQLSTAAKDRDKTPKPAPNPSEAHGTVRRRNITITLLIVYLSYLVCWTPNQFVFLVFNFGKIPNYLGSTWHIFTTILATLNICVNPVVYALRYKDFRRGLRETFGRCLGKPQD